MRQFASTTIRATNPTIVVADMIDETAIDLLAARLRTPLQIERHLTMAFEEAYRLGLRPVPSEIADSVLCRQIDDLEPTLTRHGYDVRTLACENASNHDPIRLLCMPLINHVKRLAGIGSRFARNMTPPNFHLFERNQCAG